MNTIDELMVPMASALSIIKASGLPDYGLYPKNDDALIEFIRVYAIAVADEHWATPGMIEATAHRYVRGDVTTTTDVGAVPVSRFPSAQDFRRECQRTHSIHYRQIIVNETIDAEHRVISLVVTVPVSATNEQIQNAIDALKIKSIEGAQ